MKAPDLKIRNYLGILGCLLPVLCIASAYFSPNTIYEDWWTSMSVTYYSSPVFVLVLTSVGLMFLRNDGYDTTERLINSLAGLAALCTVAFPGEASWIDESTRVGLFWLPVSTSKYIHYTAAVLLFILLGINSIVLFSKSDNKRKNMIYEICGYVILFDLVVTAITVFALHLKWSLIINQSIMLSAFGISWIVKGHMLDKYLGE